MRHEKTIVHPVEHLPSANGRNDAGWVQAFARMAEPTDTEALVTYGRRGGNKTALLNTIVEHSAIIPPEPAVSPLPDWMVRDARNAEMRESKRAGFKTVQEYREL